MEPPIHSPIVPSESLTQILHAPPAERPTRLSLFIQSHITADTRFAAFEPDTPALWSQLRLTIENFLQSLFVQGAFVGNQPSQAYFVRCDTTTMTQQDINLGRVQIVVGFAPTRPAEFVIINIALLAQPPP